MRMKLVIGMAIVATAAGGCKKIAREVAEQAAEKLGNTASGPSAEDEAMGAYADGFNTLIDKAVPCSEEYVGKVPEGGPEAGKAYRFFPYCKNAEATLPKVQQAFSTAAAKAPASLAKVKANADAAAAGFATLLGVSSEVVKYYDSGAYKDDKGAQGKQLHERSLAASSGFRSALGRLEQELAVVEDKRSQAELAQYAADKSYGYWFRKASYDGNKLLKAKPDDAQAFAAAFATFQQAEAPFKAFTASKGSALNVTFKSFADAYDRFDSKAQNFARDQKAGEKPERLEQEYGQLVQAYNNMVSLGNALREVEAQGALK